MQILYKPSGRAGEYADKGHALNLFRGCDHGCQYCYAPAVRRMAGPEGKEAFHASVVPVDRLFGRLSHDCQEFIGEPIFMSFLCDPYPANADVHGITRECIKIITESQNCVTLLTKGGTRAIKDFDLLVRDPRNKVGATLTFVDDALTRQWEPRAALFEDRLHMLSAAKDSGIETWVSVEPVIDPKESIRAMYFAAPYVDEYRIGKWNHDARAKAIDWPLFYRQASDLMNQLKKRHVFKIDLLEAAGVKR
jgi:DNA repair photolyase